MLKIRYPVATIHPKLGRLSLLCSEYIQVVFKLMKNKTEEDIIQKIISQSQELFNTLREAKEEDLNVYIDLHTNDGYTGERPDVSISKRLYRQG